MIISNSTVEVRYYLPYKQFLAIIKSSPDKKPMHTYSQPLKDLLAPSLRSTTSDPT